MRFDFVDLRLFLAVVDSGSITHGATAVGLSLPAASERLRAMETAGGIKLLERGWRGVSPTNAGETLTHHAAVVQRQLVQMRGELDEHAKGLRTTVRLMAPTAAITELLPGRLGPWMTANPHIDVDLKERQSSEIVRAISAGLTEIGIISDTVRTDGLQLRPFAVDQLVVVAPSGHPLASRKQVLFADTYTRISLAWQTAPCRKTWTGERLLPVAASRPEYGQGPSRESAAWRPMESALASCRQPLRATAAGS